MANALAWSDASVRSPARRSGRCAQVASWLFLLVALPGMACSETGAVRAGGGGPKGVELRVEVVDEAGNAVARVARDAPIALRLSLTNHGSEPLTLPLSSTQTHDAFISDARGAEVWRWSRGRMFAQMLSELRLAPGETRVFEALCDPTRSGASPLGPGRYQVVALVPAMSGELRSAPVAFEVE